MNHKLALSALAAAALAFPAAAQAGTSTTTSTASFAVADQCTVTGATVNLGTFRADQTWGDVGNAVGANRDGVPLNRNAGTAYLTFGSVTCSAGLPYTLVVRGDWLDVGSRFFVNGEVAFFTPFVKKLGSADVPDSRSTPYNGMGTQFGTNIAGVGTGTPQAIVGSMIAEFSQIPNSGAVQATPLGQSGQHATPFTYTLTF